MLFKVAGRPPRPLQMHERQANATVKGRYKSAWARSSPMQHFWGSNGVSAAG